MDNSLQKYIDLAQKTGDRLIILDPVHGHDVVIMRVEEYERLVGQPASVDVANLSLPEFSQKINEDLALWRAHHEEAEVEELPQKLEEEMKDSPLPDPFAEDFTHAKDWHGIGELLGSRYQKIAAAEPLVEVAPAVVPIPGYESAQKALEGDEEDDLFYEIPVEEEEENLAVNKPKWQEEKPLTGGAPVFFEEPV